jgi:hypothetical protein
MPVSAIAALGPRHLVIVHLLVQPGLDGIEQVPINDGGLLAYQRLALEEHLSDVKSVAQQVSKRTAGEANAANGLAALQGPQFGDNAALAQVRHQPVEAAQLQIAPEDDSDALRQKHKGAGNGLSSLPANNRCSSIVAGRTGC